MGAVPGHARSSLVRGAAGPAIIAHGAGNSPQRARQAVADAADFLEVDLWVHRGRFEARHERRLAPLPLLFEKWYLRSVPRRPFGLTELLGESTADAGVFLDLKNGGAEAARLVRAAMDSTPGATMIASSQFWHILRAVRDRCPAMELFYSIDVEAKLDLFTSVGGRDVRPRGVSCQHNLLTARTIHLFHERGLQVVGYTIDDLDRARELIGWGIDGVTTHRVRELREMVQERA